MNSCIHDSFNVTTVTLPYVINYYFVGRKRATQEVETSSTVNPVETEERDQQNRSREERVSDETLQQQQQRQQQELQRNRAAHITHDITEVC